MKLPLIACTTTLFSLAFTATCFGAEKSISESALPPAVRKTAHDLSKGAQVKGYVQDNQGGIVEYEVAMVLNGRSKDVTIASDGSLVEIEEQVQMASLPAEVQTAVKSRAGKGTILRIEALTKHGVLVAYEAQVRTAGRHSEFQVGPTGEKLSHEE